MEKIRSAAVAGYFYPSGAGELSSVIQGYLEACGAGEAARGEGGGETAGGPQPKALIVPHAGYVYSGPVAATAYARLAPFAADIRRVVLIGPSHHVGFRGLAVSTADFFATPLGRVPVDTDAREPLSRLPCMVEFDEAHRQEHSLEVQIPFLQEALGDFSILPVVVGDASVDDVATVLEAVWGGPETLIVVSSDLSHYLDYESARRTDTETSRAIEALEPEAIRDHQACGCRAIQGLLQAARHHNLECRALDLRNSGDTAGPRDRVVGYGAYMMAEA